MINLALIGKGSWGRNYIRTIGTMKSCILKPENIKTNDYRDLFKHKDIDGVIVATPGSTHYAITRDLLDHRYSVLVEKPLATRYRDALVLQKLASKNNVIAMIGHLFIYHEGIQNIKNKLRTLGNLQYICSNSYDNGPIRNDVSALWDWGPHEVSILIHVLKKFPIGVAAWGLHKTNSNSLHYDMYVIRLCFQHNIQSLSTIGWLSPIKRREMIFVGDKKTIIFDDTRTLISHKSFPLLYQLNEFISCLQEKRKPLTDISQGVYVTQILEHAEKSSFQNGRFISLKQRYEYT